MSDEHDSALAIPTKQFFVSMLTRDISLVDAILDLIDNSLDGALRVANGSEPDYARHFVSIELGENHFLIRDNCGGIPREIARKYAFKMGRDPDDDRDSDAETIGMYGVGMKRAIFKMGRDSSVHTAHDGDDFTVIISPAWLDDKDWSDLPISDSKPTEKLDTPGTVIEVCSLYPNVSRHFGNDAFVNELRTAVGEHFTVFLQRGLKVEVNGEPVKPVRVEVLVSSEATGPAPYVYRKVIEGVTVSISVGLNSGRGFEEDEDESIDFERSRSATAAGWTVFCNDRAVIVGDKSRLTGWGDGIPMYHPQFSIITGIVEFRSALAEKLPITTTKRALDTSSEVWLEAKVKMREGLRVWINYTNNWKNHPRSDQSKYWESSQSLPLERAIETVMHRPFSRRSDGAIEYNPARKKVIPVPEDRRPSSRRIVFSRPMEEIKVISSALFDRDDERPSIVGDKCFEIVLDKVQADEDGRK